MSTSHDKIDLLNLALHENLLELEASIGKASGVMDLFGQEDAIQKNSVSLGLKKLAMTLFGKNDDGDEDDETRKESFRKMVPTSEADLPKWIAEQAPKLDKRFKFIRKLGSGGMGAVFEVYDNERQSTLAMKVLHHAVPEMLISFRKEFRTLSDSAHENLVRLYQFFHEGNVLCFTMELLDGSDFLSWWRNQKTDDPALLKEALLQLAQGLNALHLEGKLHRDVKPSNVVVTIDNRVVILDFGLVTNNAERLGLLSPGECDIAGTIPFMAPEQMAGGTALDEQCDWYSFGVLIYEALTGERPFCGSYSSIVEAKTLEKYEPLPETVDPQLSNLVTELLLANPEYRPDYNYIFEALTATGRTVKPSKHWLAKDTSQVIFGRRKELNKLWEGYMGTLSGKPSVAFLRGVSGIGKTAILEAFRKELAEYPSSIPPLILSARCYEQESIPYKGIDEIIDQLSGLFLQQSKPNLPDALVKEFMVLATVFPVLQLVAKKHLFLLNSDLSSNDPATQRRTMFRALQDIFVEISEGKPIVLFIDDLQWADLECISVLDSILNHSRKMRFFVVISYRQEEERSESLRVLRKNIDANEALKPVEVKVKDLDKTSLTQLATQYAKEYTGDIAIEKIVKDSKGNPWFLMQLASAAGQGHHDISLDAILAHRYRALGRTERNFLEMIVIAGRPVTRDFAQQTAMLEGDKLQIESSLRTGRWIRSSGPSIKDTVEPYHDRIRSGLLDLIDSDVKKEHHHSLAKTLELSENKDNENLAFHYKGAALNNDAGHYYSLAGEDASRTLAFHKAVEYFTESLNCLKLPEGDKERIRLETRLAESLADSGKSARSAEAFSSLASIPNIPERRRLKFLRRAAYEFLISGHDKKGTNALKLVLKDAGIRLHDSPLASFLSLLYNRHRLSKRGLQFIPRNEEDIPSEELEAVDALWTGTIGYSMANVIRATDFQFQCCMRALDAGDLSRLTRALAHQAIQSAPEGIASQERTASYLSLAKQLASQTETNRDRGMVALATGAVDLMEGRYLECNQRSIEALDYFQKQKHDRAWQLGAANTYQLWSLVTMGEVAKLRQILPEILSDAKERGDLHARASHRSWSLPLLQMWDDKPEKALGTRDDAINTWPAEGFYAQHLVAMIARADILLYMGKPDEALAFLEEQRPAYRRSFLYRIVYGDMTLKYVQSRCALAAIAKGQGSKPGLKKLILQNCRSISKMRQPCSEAMVEALQGGLEKLDGNTSAARERYEKSAELFGENHMHVHQKAILWRLPDVEKCPETEVQREDALNWYSEQGVGDPEKTSIAYCP